jgi:predicted acylesterase/phospholipase RssA
MKSLHAITLILHSIHVIGFNPVTKYSNRWIERSMILRAKSEKRKFIIQTQDELNEYLDESNDIFPKNRKGRVNYAQRLKACDVKGDTQIIGSTDLVNVTHPVVKLLHHRKKFQTKGTDGFKVALAIEGGGMRGCLSAGMVAAIYYLGLEDVIDVVYGSSAGGVIGSYFITRQLHWFGPEIYYDSLTTAGREFIDSTRLLRALGVGLLNPRLWYDILTKPHFGKPVLNLDFLLKRTLQESKPLDWDEFVKQQSKQPIKIVASNLRDETPIVMDMENGSFNSLPELAQCMHASCLLPGIAGPIMNRDEASGDMLIGNKKRNVIPMADALLYEPMPFKSAIAEGATHVIVLRTRPDGTDVTGKTSIFERMILHRYFQRKNKLPRIFDYMRKGLHKMLYAQDVLTLNDKAKDMSREFTDISDPHIMTIAVPPGSPEIGRLESRRLVIFDGVRRGFARAYDALVEDPKERGKGNEVARRFFPDEILNYDPQQISTKDNTSAFEVYLTEKGENVNNWKFRAP